MKRWTALCVLGLATAGILPAQGQGYFHFNNYQAPYVPIAYHVSPSVAPYYPEYTHGAPVGVDDGIQIELWWALGSGDSQPPLEFGALVNWSDYDGYTDQTQQFIMGDYQPGQTVYLQLRAGHGLFLSGHGPVIQVERIANLNSSPPEIPPQIYTPGFFVIVPEPSGLCLASVIVSGLIITRCRRTR